MPGQTLFIMGASGAGKTSLLNILSDRIASNSSSKINKHIVINDNMVVDDQNFGKVSGYVMQDDILFQHFSPRDALRFAANLKLSSLSEKDREDRINTLLDQLSLTKIADTVVGSIM